MATKNEVSLADYQLPEGALAKSGNKPDRMVDIAFDDMSPWFSRLTNPIENAYTQGMNSGNNKSATYIGLGKLAKKANDFMAQLSAYVNRDIGAKPEVRVPQYKLPSDASDKSGLEPGQMVAKAIQELVPWFTKCINQFRPYYLKFARNDKANPKNIQLRLRLLQNRINDEKTIMQKHLNSEIAKRQSGGGSRSADNSDEDALFELAALILAVVLDVEEGEPESEDVPNVDDVEIDFIDYYDDDF